MEFKIIKGAKAHMSGTFNVGFNSVVMGQSLNPDKSISFTMLTARDVKYRGDLWDVQVVERAGELSAELTNHRTNGVVKIEKLNLI